MADTDFHTGFAYDAARPFAPRGWSVPRRLLRGRPAIYAACGGFFCLGLVLAASTALRDERPVAKAVILVDGKGDAASLGLALTDVALRHVVEAEHLADDPAFAEQPSSLNARLGLVFGWKVLTQRESRSGEALQHLRDVVTLKGDAGVSLDMTATGSITTLQAHRAEPLSRSAFEIDVTLTEPEKAARLATAVAQALADEHAVDRPLDEGRNQPEALDLAMRLQAARQALVEAESGEAGAVPDPFAPDAGSSQISGLSSAKADVERVAHAMSVARSLPLSGLHFATPELDRCLTQYAEAQRQYDQRKLVLGDKHPELIAAQAQLTGLQKELRAQWQKVADIANQNLRMAQARALAFGTDAPALAARVPGSSEARLETLRADVAHLSRAYEQALAGSKAKGLNDAFFTVLPAPVPAAPVQSAGGLFLGGALMLGAMFGAGVLGTGKRKRRQFKPGPQPRPAASVEPRVPESDMIAIPQIKREGLAGFCGFKPPLDIACFEAIDRPHSDFSRVMADLFEQAMQEVRRGTIKILIIAEKAQMGATTVAINLACIAAQMEHRTLLIEANRQRPALSSLISPQVRSGLIELAGTDCVICPLRPDLSVIPLFDGERIDELEAKARRHIKGLTRHFDVIILDGGVEASDKEALDMARAVNLVFRLGPRGLSILGGAVEA